MNESTQYRLIGKAVRDVFSLRKEYPEITDAQVLRVIDDINFSVVYCDAKKLVIVYKERPDGKNSIVFSCEIAKKIMSYNFFADGGVSKYMHDC